MHNAWALTSCVLLLHADPAIMLERAVGGVVGCLVADAAAMPVQWIYDLEVLDDLLAQRQQVRLPSLPSARSSDRP